MADSYDDAANLLAQTAGGATTRGLLIARLTLRSMAAYIRQQSAPDMAGYSRLRDAGMAENIIELADGLYPKNKIFVWAHNAHIQHGNELIDPNPDVFPGVRVSLAGSDVRAHYGSNVYTVGLYAARGKSKNNRGEIFDIPEPDQASLEAKAASIPGDAVFLDLDRAQQDPAFGWLEKPITARFDARFPRYMSLSEQYDGVLVVDQALPRSEMGGPVEQITESVQPKPCSTAP